MSKASEELLAALLTLDKETSRALAASKRLVKEADKLLAAVKAFTQGLAPKQPEEVVPPREEMN
jgi:hypothetical protein